MTSAIKLEYRNLGKHFDGLQVFRDVTFAVPAGEITALIGPNGAGKSTLINMTCGVFAQDAGTIVKDGSELRRRPASQALTASLAGRSAGAAAGVHWSHPNISRSVKSDIPS